MTPEQSRYAAVKTTVLDILSDVLTEPVDDLLAQQVLGVHEWDSLSSLEALVQFEAHFEVTLDLRAYHAAREVDDLVVLILAAQGRTASPARP